MAKAFRILSLDGGGIRGAATAQVLYELEQDLGASLYDSFDLIAGTSTGALIAIYLAAEQADGEDLLSLYSVDNARRIMDKSIWDEHLPVQSQPKYDGEGKREVLNEYLGNRRIQDVAKPLLVTAYDIVMRRVVVFKSQRGSDAAYNPLLKEIADATSAAPTYFPTVETSDSPPRWLIDGGVAANNPSMCALAEALREGHALEDIRLLSIGTGTPARGADDATAMGRASQSWGGIGWLRNGLIEHLFAGNTSTCGYQCEVLLGERYVRVDGPLMHASDDLDAVSRGNIQHLRALGRQWYEDNERLIRALLS